MSAITEETEDITSVLKKRMEAARAADVPKQDEPETEPPKAPEPEPKPEPKRAPAPEPKKETPAPKVEDKPVVESDGFPDPDAIPDEPPVGEKTDKAKLSWQGMKKELKEQAEQIESLQAQLEAASKQTVDNSQFEQLQSELAQAREQLAEAQRHIKAADFTRTDEYHRMVKAPTEAVDATLVTLAEAYEELDADELKAAIRISDPKARERKIAEIVEGLPNSAQYKAFNAADRYEEVERRKASLEQDAEKLWQKQKAEREEMDRKNLEKDLADHRRASKDAFDALSARHAFLKPVEGEQYTAWNRSISDAQNRLGTVNLDLLTAQERGEILAKAESLPFFEKAVNHYASKLKTLAEEKRALEAELDRARGTSPNPGGGQQTQSGAATAAEDEEIGRMSIGERIASRARAGA